MKATVLIGAALAAAVCSAADVFNGKDLVGWTSVADHGVTGGYSAAEPTWSVVGGAIRTTGTPFGYLRTQRSDFGDFKLKVDYRWWRPTAQPLSGIAKALAAGETSEKPFGEWNTLELEVRGDTLVSTLNGVVRNRVKGLKVRKGAIALPSEGGAVEFRNLTIAE